MWIPKSILCRGMARIKEALSSKGSSGPHQSEKTSPNLELPLFFPHLGAAYIFFQSTKSQQKTYTLVSLNEPLRLETSLQSIKDIIISPTRNICIHDHSCPPSLPPFPILLATTCHHKISNCRPPSKGRAPKTNLTQLRHHP